MGIQNIKCLNASATSTILFLKKKRELLMLTTRQPNTNNIAGFR